MAHNFTNNKRISHVRNNTFAFSLYWLPAQKLNQYHLIPLFHLILYSHRIEDYRGIFFFKCNKCIYLFWKSFCCLQFQSWLYFPNTPWTEKQSLVIYQRQDDHGRGINKVIALTLTFSVQYLLSPKLKLWTETEWPKTICLPRKLLIVHFINQNQKAKTCRLKLFLHAKFAMTDLDIDGYFPGGRILNGSWYFR